jgi:hypothetical protein
MPTATDRQLNPLLSTDVQTLGKVLFNSEHRFAKADVPAASHCCNAMKL